MLKLSYISGRGFADMIGRLIWQNSRSIQSLGCKEGTVITGMNHTGIVVRDLESSEDFYQQGLGLKVVARRERQGQPISQVVGYENSRIKVALLGSGKGHLVELIQYINPVGPERFSDERNALGATHLAFDVEDIGQTYRHLIRHGGHKLNPPVEMVPGRKVCYLQDPDGNWIELIEDISGG